MKSYRYLLFGKTRTEIAAALIEYRRFAQNNPDHEITAHLIETSRCIRQGLREQMRYAA